MEYRPEVIAAVIKRLRKERKKSQEVMSGFAAMARPHLSMIERGERIPDLYTVWRMADALDMRPSELVALIEEEMELAEQKGKS